MEEGEGAGARSRSEVEEEATGEYVRIQRCEMETMERKLAAQQAEVHPDYLLYWYKSTNNDTGGGEEAGGAAGSGTQFTYFTSTKYKY